jgi:hypothetical protein
VQLYGETAPLANFESGDHGAVEERVHIAEVAEAPRVQDMHGESSIKSQGRTV